MYKDDEEGSVSQLSASTIESPTSDQVPEYSPEMWNNPDLEGQLTKQGHVVKNWKVRWFILQHNRLFYFKTKPNKYTTKPTGCITLKDAIINLNPKVGKSNCIEITEKDTSKPYLIYANSKQDLDTWIQAIQEGVSRLDTQPNSVRHHLHIDSSEYTSLVRSVTLHRSFRFTVERFDLTS